MNKNQIAGCILGGAIGDAMGSAFENQTKEADDIYYPFGKLVEEPAPYFYN